MVGSALAIGSEDVAKADAYEVANYRRITVTLASGRIAYVYVAAEDASTIECSPSAAIRIFEKPNWPGQLSIPAETGMSLDLTRRNIPT